MAMRMMGEQFVSGQTISEALANNRKMEARGFRYSYDMLGEAATTAEDADRYYASYEQAIHAIGKAAAGRGIYEGPGISIKLSALHPRYSRAQRERVMAELLPRVKRADRAGAQLRHRPEHRRRGSRPPGDLAGPAGGAVLRARAGRLERHRLRDPGLPEARALRDRLRDRPGAPQPPPRDGAAGQGRLLGQRDQARPGRWPGRLPGLYPQDLHRRGSGLACARKLLGAPRPYPQFATHNAYTLSAIYQLAGQNYYPGQYEFQCLHGMGEPLYDEVVGPLAQGS